MLLIKFNSAGVVLDGPHVFPLLPVCEAPVVIKVGFLTLKFYGLSEALYSFIELSLPVKANTLIVIGVSIGRLNLDGRGVVLDGSIELTNLIISEATIKEGLEVRGQDLEGFRVESYSGKVVPLLPGLVTLGVICLCLLFTEMLLLGEWWLLLGLG